MSLPAHVSLDSIGRPSVSGAMLVQWGDQVDDNDSFNYGEAAWNVATLSGTWTIVSTSFQPPGYRQAGTRVWLRGACASTSGSGPSTLFTLPSGYWPAKQAGPFVVAAIVGTTATTATVAVSPTGAVVCSLGTAAQVCLDAVSFDLLP